MIPGMRYSQSVNDGLLDQPSQNDAVMMDKDVMRLLPPTWKTPKAETLQSGLYGGDFQAFDGFRVRPHVYGGDANAGAPVSHQAAQQQQQQQHQQQQQAQAQHNAAFPGYAGMFYNQPMQTMQQPNLYYQAHASLPVMPTHTSSPLQQEPLKARPIRKRRRPPHSYASLIAQAILTSQEQKMTLREIYEWVQTRYPHLYEANETGWQNTIRHNLSLNRCFRKIPRTQDNGKKGTKGGYWTVDVDQLNNTNFGRQILDSGFLGSIEYWHQEQEQQQQQQLRHVMVSSASTSSTLSQLSSVSSSTSCSSAATPSTGMAMTTRAQQPTQQQQAQQAPPAPQPPQATVDEIDFLAPFYSTAAGTGATDDAQHHHAHQTASHYTTDILDTQSGAQAHRLDPHLQNQGFYTRMKKSFEMHDTSMTSSKTSSVRGSTSPNSPETDMSTPTFHSMTFQRQHQPTSQQQQQQQQQAKMELDPLLNPSLMRVNNILN